jgi:hypothetical protein
MCAPDADLAALRLRDCLSFFRDELRGRFVAPRALKAELAQPAARPSEAGRLTEQVRALVQRDLAACDRLAFA